VSAGDAAYVFGALLAVMAICSLPMFASLRGAGPQYRAAVTRQLVVGWAIGAVVTGWLVVGWFAIESGGRWFGTYRDFTLVLMGASGPLLYLGIRAGNRSLAAAQAADRGLPAQGEASRNRPCI
jgi:hypothetical protein